MTPYGIIYSLTNTVTGKSYVGQTTMSLVARWRLHKSAALGGHPGCLRLYNSIRKHGPDVFEHRVLDEATDLEELNRKEVHWISALGTLVPDGYNLMAGGKSHGKHSLETRERMSRVKMGKKASEESRERMRRAQKGRQVSLQARDRMRQANFGKKASAETRMKMSASHEGKRLAPRSMEHAQKIADALRGKKASLESRLKMAAAHMGRKQTPETIAKRLATIKANPEIQQIIRDAHKGKRHSEETKEKMRQVALLREARKRLAREIKHVE